MEVCGEAAGYLVSCVTPGGVFCRRPILVSEFMHAALANAAALIFNTMQMMFANKRYNTPSVEKKKNSGNVRCTQFGYKCIRENVTFT